MNEWLKYYNLKMLKLKCNINDQNIIFYNSTVKMKFHWN